MDLPILVTENTPTVEANTPDDILIVAASWEERCLGLARRFGTYQCKTTILSIYDTPSDQREKHIFELSELLKNISNGNLKRVSANHQNPLINVREIVNIVRQSSDGNIPHLSIDISTFSRNHLLQLLQGLDLSGFLNNCHFFYTEPIDYDTKDDEPISQGIRSIKVIDSFTGRNFPSKDSLLVLFLGYEGRRTLALWEHLEPNITIPVIPDPPFREDWANRTEVQNCYLLSTIPTELVQRSHSIKPSDTEDLLIKLITSEEFNIHNYNYRIAPLGTKPQTLGIYRFWRRNRGLATIMYASPVTYREDRAKYSVGRTWLIDKSKLWNDDNLL